MGLMLATVTRRFGCWFIRYSSSLLVKCAFALAFGPLHSFCVACVATSTKQLQKSRIILFVGSPVTESPDVLKKLGAELKKNNVAIDIVNFGETEDNHPKLEALVQAANKGDNWCAVCGCCHCRRCCCSYVCVCPCVCVCVCSHLVDVPPGPHLLSDMIIASPICEGSNTAAALAGSDNLDLIEQQDPELAMVLRMSMEEENQRRAALIAQQRGDQGQQPTAAPTAAAVAATAPATREVNMADADLEAAIRMSMGGGGGSGGSGGGDYDEDAALQLALQMSLSDAQQQQQGSGDAMTDATPVDGSGGGGGGADVRAGLRDASLLTDILSQLPGVDPTDARVQVRTAALLWALVAD